MYGMIYRSGSDSDAVGNLEVRQRLFAGGRLFPSRARHPHPRRCPPSPLHHHPRSTKRTHFPNLQSPIFKNEPLISNDRLGVANVRL